jgi:hypothetical protein
MKLKCFIRQLKKIADEKGGDLEVIMADSIPVVNPKFFHKDSVLKPYVVITDQD